MKSQINPFNKLKLVDVDGPAVLSFNTNNAKLKGTKTATFSLPAGYSCPGACDCLAWFDRDERKLKDGPKSKFRCFAASIEAAFTSVQKSVDKNFTILKNAESVEAMAMAIDMSLPSRFYENIRVHADGDFFNQNYFLAWMQVATDNPQRLFYAYTKSLPIWVKFKACVPPNFVLTASRGGKWDDLIEKNNLRSATVVYHPEEAEAANWEIDHDDSLARDPNAGSFALLLHGMQPKDSDASSAIKRMKKEDVKFSYGRASSKSKSQVNK